MLSLWSLLDIAHFVGLAWCIGAATAKVLLLLKCRSDLGFLPAYGKVAPVLTRQIVAGLILTTLTGIIWLIRGYDFSPTLIVKICLVGAIWVLGPIIDNAIEPKFHKLAPAPGQQPTADFIRIRKLFLGVEIFATLLFYAIIVVWVLR